MLPKTFPPFPERNDIEIYGQLNPAKEVGGDLYDFFIRDEKLYFCIGDVSGKGVPASLVMAVIRTLFRTISFREASVKLTGDPGTQTVWGTVLLKLMDEGGRCIDYIPFLPGPHSSDKHMHIRIPMTWEHQAGRASVSLVSTYHQCSNY